MPSRIKALLEGAEMHLKTGFLGTPVLCRALSKCGDSETAYTLLLQEDLPSWLYEVNMGATTIWERWNAVLPDGVISGIGMNSMNHYAYGAVGNWLYTRRRSADDGAGLPEIPTGADPRRRSDLGKGQPYLPLWKDREPLEIRDGKFVMDFTVPEGTTADVCLPDGTRGTYEPGSYSVECAYEGK